MISRNGSVRIGDKPDCPISSVSAFKKLSTSTPSMSPWITRHNKNHNSGANKFIRRSTGPLPKRPISRRPGMVIRSLCNDPWSDCWSLSLSRMYTNPGPNMSPVRRSVWESWALRAIKEASRSACNFTIQPSALSMPTWRPIAKMSRAATPILPIFTPKRPLMLAKKPFAKSFAPDPCRIGPLDPPQRPSWIMILSCGWEI